MSNEELAKHAKEYILSQYGIEKGENENRMISLFMEGYLFHKEQVKNLSLGVVSKQRELLIAFSKYAENRMIEEQTVTTDLYINEFLSNL